MEVFRHINFKGVFASKNPRWVENLKWKKLKREKELNLKLMKNNNDN